MNSTISAMAKLIDSHMEGQGIDMNENMKHLIDLQKEVQDHDIQISG